MGASTAGSELPDLSVIVPTRNERLTVRPLTQRTSEHLTAVGLSWEIVFVDDSEDDTPSHVASLADEGFPVRLYHRPCSQRVGGLSGAIAVGLAHGRTEVLAVMDADLQHPPEVLESPSRPLLAEEADIGSGSRYIAGGDAAGLETQWRRLVSKGSRTLTHVLFAETRLSRRIPEVACSPYVSRLSTASSFNRRVSRC
jgi:dolichol-phosphate mannosyltransferase